MDDGTAAVAGDTMQIVELQPNADETALLLVYMVSDLLSQEAEAREVLMPRQWSRQSLER